MATVESTRREQDELSSERTALVRHHLKNVLGSHAFEGSKRAQDFLHLIVGHALDGQIDSLRERMIGAEMFGRPVDYDTGNDSVVRVKANEVRKKLAQYYLETEGKPAVRIELPSGHYVPRFHFEPLETAAQSQMGSIPLSSVEQPTAQDLERLDQRTEANVNEASRRPGQRLQRASRVLAGVALGFALLATIGYKSFKWRYSNLIARPEIRSIVILPFENLSGNPGQDYFADGMTEELIADLGQVSALRVISRTSAMSYKGTKKDLPGIAHELGVQGVVEGSVLRDGNQVRITAKLIDARTDHSIWTHTYVRDITNILALQGDLAQAIADEVSVNVTPQMQARLTRVRPVSREAEDMYLQGMLRLNASDCQSAIGYFQKATYLDPNSAQTHAALASCSGTLGEGGIVSYSEAFFKQETEAVRAIELDDSLPEGHAELANASMNLKWDWAKAAKEFSRALELNPSLASVHERYAVYLERTGRLPEAIAEVERGLDLDPVSARSFRNAGFTYYFSRQYDQALLLMRRAQERNINLPDEAFLLGDIYAEKGMYAKSAGEFLRLDDSPHNLGHLGNAYARAGRVYSARKIISQLEKDVQKNGVGRYEIALVYAGLGEKNLAFSWLEESYKTHSEGLTNLKIDPCLDPLRSDPRFDDLVRRVGLAP
jgi:TolB-like protein